MGDAEFGRMGNFGFKIFYGNWSTIIAFLALNGLKKSLFDWYGATSFLAPLFSIT